MLGFFELGLLEGLRESQAVNRHRNGRFFGLSFFAIHLDAARQVAPSLRRLTKLGHFQVNLGHNSLKHLGPRTAFQCDQSAFVMQIRSQTLALKLSSHFRLEKVGRSRQRVHGFELVFCFLLVKPTVGHCSSALFAQGLGRRFHDRIFEPANSFLQGTRHLAVSGGSFHGIPVFWCWR